MIFEILFFETGSVEFLTSPTSFTNYVDVRANKKIILNTSLTLYDNTMFIVDTRCKGLGTIYLQKDGYILSPLNMTWVKIYGGSIDINIEGGISSTDSMLQFGERCNYGESIGIGSPVEGPETMALSHDEIDQLTAGRLFMFTIFFSEFKIKYYSPKFSRRGIYPTKAVLKAFFCTL